MSKSDDEKFPGLGAFRKRVLSKTRPQDRAVTARNLNIIVKNAKAKGLAEKLQWEKQNMGSLSVRFLPGYKSTPNPNKQLKVENSKDNSKPKKASAIRQTKTDKMLINSNKSNQLALSNVTDSSRVSKRQRMVRIPALADSSSNNKRDDCIQEPIRLSRKQKRLARKINVSSNSSSAVSSNSSSNYEQNGDEFISLAGVDSSLFFSKFGGSPSEGSPIYSPVYSPEGTMECSTDLDHQDDIYQQIELQETDYQHPTKHNSSLVFIANPSNAPQKFEIPSGILNPPLNVNSRNKFELAPKVEPGTPNKKQVFIPNGSHDFSPSMRGEKFRNSKKLNSNKVLRGTIPGLSSPVNNFQGPNVQTNYNIDHETFAVAKDISGMPYAQQNLLYSKLPEDKARDTASAINMSMGTPIRSDNSRNIYEGSGISAYKDTINVSISKPDTPPKVNNNSNKNSPVGYSEAFSDIRNSNSITSPNTFASNSANMQRSFGGNILEPDQTNLSSNSKLDSNKNWPKQSEPLIFKRLKMENNPIFTSLPNVHESNSSSKADASTLCTHTPAFNESTDNPYENEKHLGANNSTQSKAQITEKQYPTTNILGNKSNIDFLSIPNKVKTVQSNNLKELDIERRRKRFEKYSENLPYVDHQIRHTIIGTNTNLEKPYFRLTGQVNPAVVRPPYILEQSLQRLLILQQTTESKVGYSYLIDQYKSIRQDLTVQHIQNDLTSRVYESNVRLALQHHDLGEVNKCLTQLSNLYKGCPEKYFETKYEFYAYIVYYNLYTMKWDELGLMLMNARNDTYLLRYNYLLDQQNLKSAPATKQMHPESVEERVRMYKRALDIVKLFQRNEIFVLRGHLQNTYELENILLNYSVRRLQIHSLRSICYATFTRDQVIPIAKFSIWVGTSNIEQTKLLLSELGVPITPEESVKVKDAYPILDKLYQAASHVDIKGQK